MSKQRWEGRMLRRYDPLAVLTNIAMYQRHYDGHSPSERRIQRDLGVSAPSVVHTIVQRLQRAELLTITRYGRGNGVDLTLTDAGRAAVQRWQAEHPAPGSSAAPPNA